jgi:hypothetical protein
MYTTEQITQNLFKALFIYYNLLTLFSGELWISVSISVPKLLFLEVVN